MQVYQTNHAGYFVGTVIADESPREPGVFLIPAGCIETAPPTIPEGKVARWVDGAWVLEDPPVPEPTEPEPPEPTTPDTMTFAQLLIGLVAEGWITEAEGEAWLTGTLPAPVEALIASLPAEQRFAARARAVRPSVILRNDALVLSLAAQEGKTEAELDTFFETYALI